MKTWVKLVCAMAAMLAMGCATVTRTASRSPDGTYSLSEKIRATWGGGLQDAAQGFQASYSGGENGQWTVQSQMNGTGMTSPDISNTLVQGMLGVGAMVNDAYKTALPIKAEADKAAAESKTGLATDLIERIAPVPVK